jgi:hypothetical protein
MKAAFWRLFFGPKRAMATVSKVNAMAIVAIFEMQS